MLKTWKGPLHWNKLWSDLEVILQLKKTVKETKDLRHTQSCVESLRDIATRRITVERYIHREHGDKFLGSAYTMEKLLDLEDAGDTAIFSCLMNCPWCFKYLTSYLTVPCVWGFLMWWRTPKEGTSINIPSRNRGTVTYCGQCWPYIVWWWRQCESCSRNLSSKE